MKISPYHSQRGDGDGKISAQNPGDPVSAAGIGHCGLRTSPGTVQGSDPGFGHHAGEERHDRHEHVVADVVKDNGTNAELLADKLSIEFDKCPKTFTEELNTQGKETIKLIAELTTYGHYFEDFSGYKERVNELADSTAKTELQNSIDSILGANTQVGNAEDYSATTESFDVETIKHFMKNTGQYALIQKEKK